MNKFILFCLFFFLISNAYNSQTVSSKKNNGTLQGVITFKEAVDLVRTSGKKNFVFALFHSDFCKYCNMVKSFVQQHPSIAFIKEEEWMNKKTNVLNASSPIVILSKNIHNGSRDKPSPFFDELNKRTTKVQVPALQVGERILFESKDIMKFLMYVIDYLSLEETVAQKNLKNSKNKINGNFLNVESKINSNKKNKEVEEEADENEEEEEYEEEYAEPQGGCGFNMNVNEDLLIKLLQNKEVLDYLNSLAFNILSQQRPMGHQVPMGDATTPSIVEEFEESKKPVKKNNKKDTKKNGKTNGEGGLRKSTTS